MEIRYRKRKINYANYSFCKILQDSWEDLICKIHRIIISGYYIKALIQDKWQKIAQEKYEKENLKTKQKKEHFLGSVH